MNTSIWVITHKKYEPIKDSLYKTIHVGKALSEDLGYIGDDTKDNISSKNKSYCELTGLYWLWKNYDGDIIGICHYRRFFMQNDMLLTKEYIEDTLKEYDCIIPSCGIVGDNESVRQQYDKKHYISDFDMCRQVIQEKYPEYIEAFDIMQGSALMNFANMIITYKQIFDKYCEWLFDILFEVEKRIDISNRDEYQKRAMGFLSERLLKVWLIKNNYKVKEQLVKMIETNEFDKNLQSIKLMEQIFNTVTSKVIERYKKGEYINLPTTEYQKELLVLNEVNIKKIPIWICCWQGEENLTDVEKKCIDSVRKNLYSDLCELYIITLDNCQKYVTFSPQVIEKFNNGNISLNVLSQRLSMELLYRYGGVWIDSTCYLTDSRINELIKSNQFYIQKSKKLICEVEGLNINEFFILGKAGCLLFGFMMEAIDEYYIYMGNQFENDMFRGFIDIAYNNLEEVRKLIDSCELYNPNVIDLDDNSDKLFKDDCWQKINQNTWLFKLSSNKEYRACNIVEERTYYGEVVK